MLSDSKPRNPYGHLTPIRNAELFFGREDSLEMLCDALLGGQSIAITGPRRVGKSSLLACLCLLEIQQRVGCNLDQHLLILIDLEEHLQKTPDAFFSFVCQQLLSQGREKLSLDMLAGSGSEQFSHLLYQFQSQRCHPVLLLDEFDSIVRNSQFNPDFFSFLRAQANSGKVSYVTASLSTLDEICHSELVGSPFFNIFSHHSLGPLSEEAARALIMVPSSNAGSPFTEHELRYVLNVAGRHPFYIQRTCYFLFQQKSQSQDKIHFPRLNSQVYHELLPHFTYEWNHLPPEQQDQMRREALRKDSHWRKLPILSESSFFRKFVRTKFKATAGELTVEYLRDVLDKLDDFKFLGECRLSYLNIIFSQEQVETFTTVERGIRVHKLLEDALAQLQPGGPYNSAAPEWQIYTVLQSCYFKPDRRSNKQLASYLSMSERDFYRKRDDAISALLAILFKMEAFYTEEPDHIVPS